MLGDCIVPEPGKNHLSLGFQKQGIGVQGRDIEQGSEGSGSAVMNGVGSVEEPEIEGRMIGGCGWG